MAAALAALGLDSFLAGSLRSAWTRSSPARSILTQAKGDTDARPR
jgi:hypothetical protein